MSGIATGAVLGGLVITGCGGDADAPESSATGEDRERACIERVLARDSELGAVRNHAPETGPIADAVRAYVSGMDALDYSGCPPEFAAAFVRHRNAWESSLEFFDQHAELRGELHDVFEEIRARGGETEAGLRAVESEIWDTWAEVEAASER